MDTKKKKFHYGYIVLIGVLLINVLQGMWGNTIAIYITPLSQVWDVPLTMVSMGSTIQTFVAAGLVSIMGIFFKKFDTKITLLTAVVSLIIAMLITALAPNPYVYWWHGLFTGIAVDIISFLLAPVVLGNWFKKGQSTLYGLCLATQYFSGAVFSTFASYIISNYGYPYALYIQAIICAVVGIPVSLFVIVKSPAQKGLEPIGHKEFEQEQAEKAGKTQILSGVDSKIARKTAAFYMLCVSAGIWSFIGLLQWYLNNYAQSEGFSVIQAGYISTGNLFGGLIGYLLAGVVCDWLSTRWGITIHSVLGIIAFVTILLVGTNSVTALVIAGALIGYAYAGKSVIMSSIVKECFGPRDFAIIWSNVAAINMFIAGFAHIAWTSLAGAFGYSICFIIGAIIYATLLLLANLSLKNARKYKDQWTDVEVPVA